MGKKKTKPEIEKELRAAKKEIKNLKKRYELLWKMHVYALDTIADMRIKEDMRFEAEYEYILSGESGLSDEEKELYLRHNYDRYKKLKKGLEPWKPEWDDACTAEQNEEC